MISYPTHTQRRLRRDAFAELDAEHDAILEVLLHLSTLSTSEFDRCVNARSRWRRLDHLKKMNHQARCLRAVAEHQGFILNHRHNGIPIVFNPFEIEATRLESEIDSSSAIAAQAFETLNPQDRDLLRARLIDEKPLRDIADANGCTEAAVSTRLQRAIKRLKTAYFSIERRAIEVE